MSNRMIICQDESRRCGIVYDDYNVRCQLEKGHPHNHIGRMNTCAGQSLIPRGWFGMMTWKRKMKARCIDCYCISELNEDGLCEPCADFVSTFISAMSSLPPMWRIEYSENGIYTVYDNNGREVIVNPLNDILLRKTAWSLYRREYDWHTYLPQKARGKG